MELSATLLMLARLREWDRLSTRRTPASVEPRTAWAGVGRWMRGEGRDDTLAFLQRVVERVEKLPEGSEALARCGGAADGVARLMDSTYAGDERVCASLQLLVERLRIFVAPQKQ